MQFPCIRGEETAHFPGFPYREYTKMAAERRKAAFAEEGRSRDGSQKQRDSQRQVQRRRQGVKGSGAVSGRIGGKGQRGPTRFAVLREGGNVRGKAGASRGRKARGKAGRAAARRQLAFLRSSASRR